MNMALAQKTHIGILFVILAAAIAMRVILLASTPATTLDTPWYPGERGDSVEYNEVAKNIAAGAGFSKYGSPTANVPPLYPFFLASLYALFGSENFLAVRIAQVLLTVGALAAFWFLARRVGGTGTAHLATTALALHPRLAVYNLSLLTETLSFALLAFWALAAIRWHQTYSPQLLIAAAGLLSLAALTRPTAAPLVALFLAWIWRTQRSEKRSGTLSAALIVLGVSLAVVSPWVIRNYLMFKRLIPIANVGGAVFGEALDRTVLEPLGISNRNVLEVYAALPEAAFADAGYRLFLREVLAHPAFFLEVTLKKFLYWWSPSVKYTNASLGYGLIIFNALVLALAIGGFLHYGRKRGWAIPSFFLLMILNFTAIHALTIPYHRYRFPGVDPYLMLFAGYLGAALWVRTGARAPERSRKKILFLITQAELGGAQRFLIEAATRLARHHEVLVAAGATLKNTQPDLAGRLQAENVQTRTLRHLVRPISPLKDLSAFLEIFALARKEKPDVLFLLSSKAGFLGGMAGRLAGVRKIIYRIGGWSFNDPQPGFVRRFYLLAEKLAASWKDVIIVNSTHDARQAQTLGIKPRERLAMIHNGLDAEAMNFLNRGQARKRLGTPLPPLDFTEDAPWIGTIANFYKTKGLPHLIQAMTMLSREYPSAKLLIVGGGGENLALQRLIDRLGLGDRVFLAGPRDRAWELLKAFDVFVLPSLKEGFPWVILEAMAAEVPVVATRVGAIPEIISDGDNGLVVDPGDSAMLHQAIARLLENPSLRIALARRGRETVTKKFTADRMFGEIERVL